MKNGIVAAIGAYTMWGILPVFWKTINHIPATEILCHRVVWSLLFVALILSLRRHWNWIGRAVRNPVILVTFFGTACILALNWVTYIWAVNSNFVVEASLGYFINPLVSVVLGVLFLKERLRPWQWLSISLALIGVLYLTFSYGRFPWIALTLAFTFGFYGLLRKTAALQALEGLAFEMAVLFLPALGYLFYLESSGRAAFGHEMTTVSVLLAATGIITALPLLLFAYGARRIRLSTVGILQYIAPTLQFILGVFVYRESFPASRFVGFVIIWAALAIYTLESIVRFRGRKSVASPQTSLAGR